MRNALALSAITLLLLAACATGPRDVPYPAFMQADELEYVFLAELPGIRAKRLSGDLRSGRFSALLDLPESWRWNTGAAPGKSVEIYVISGEIMLADLSLQAGNHAYLPPGSMGMSLRTSRGARILYFLDEANPNAVIQTPLFMSREVVPWRPADEDLANPAVAEKELRDDPGSGARTWLLKVSPGAKSSWMKATTATEGYLLAGEARHSECVGGKVVTGKYEPGGYFRRPAGAVYGAPPGGAETGAVWLMRRQGGGAPQPVDGCRATAPPEVE